MNYKEIIYKNKIIIEIAISIGAVISISGLVEIYGLYDRIYFNKSVIAFVVFLLSLIMVKRTEEDWRKEKRTVCFAFMLSFLLTFTEILGTGLRLSANIGGMDFSLLTILWMTVSSAILSPITEPYILRSYEQL